MSLKPLPHLKRQRVSHELPGGSQCSPASSLPLPQVEGGELYPEQSSLHTPAVLLLLSAPSSHVSLLDVLTAWSPQYGASLQVVAHRFLPYGLVWFCAPRSHCSPAASSNL